MLAHSVASAADDAIRVASRRYADFHMLRLERRQFTSRMMAMFGNDPAPAGDRGRHEQVFSTVFSLAMLLQLHDPVLAQMRARYRVQEKQFGNRLNGYATTIVCPDQEGE